MLLFVDMHFKTITLPIYKMFLGNYDTLIMTCSLPIMILSLYLTYLNPNSCLSTSVQSCIKVFPKLIIVLSVIFVIWMINWFCYFTLANVFHLFVTIYLL